jgi:putative ABC transport system ATP-binding protein
MLIEMKTIEKLYNIVNVKALSNVSFTVEKGEFLSIMGPSGSGKTTLLYIMGCLLKPTKGEYILDGVNVSMLKDDKLAELRNKKIGFVFQSFDLIPRTTALENVELPLIYAGINSNKRRMLAVKALKDVGLEDRIFHRPNELSGGQSQRVAIARALVNNPDIILADEPTGNLDIRSGQEVIDIFIKLNRSGKTIILVTHEENIAKLADRIIYLSDGRIIKDERLKKSSRIKKVNAL